MQVPDQVKDKSFATACIVGWFAGATFGILTFAMTMNTTLSLLVGLFFGFIFGWATYVVIIHKYTQGYNDAKEK